MSKIRHLAASRSSACRVAQLSSRTSGITSAMWVSCVEGHFKVPSGRFKIGAPSVPVMTELKVHTYTAAEPGIFVNSYLLETADGVVLVDAGLLVSDARALAARIAALRKP